jgi:hypothetical protein
MSHLGGVGTLPLVIAMLLISEICMGCRNWQCQGGNTSRHVWSPVEPPAFSDQARAAPGIVNVGGQGESQRSKLRGSEKKPCQRSPGADSSSAARCPEYWLTGSVADHHLDYFSIQKSFDESSITQHYGVTLSEPDPAEFGISVT